MCVKSLPIPPIPDETARVARAIFGEDALAIQLRDRLGTIYTGSPHETEKIVR